MDRLFAVIFALLVAVQVGIAVATTVLLFMFVGVMWERSPWRAVAAVFVFVAVIAGVFWAWQHERRANADGDVHPGPSMSRIPLSGTMGAVYMLQFVVWALLIPEVGLFYAVLIGGGLLLVPVVRYVNRRSRQRAGHVGGWGLIVVICGLLLVSVASSRELSLAGLFGVAVVAGAALAGVLIVWHRNRGRPTIAPYVK